MVKLTRCGTGQADSREHGCGSRAAKRLEARLVKLTRCGTGQAESTEHGCGSRAAKRLEARCRRRVAREMLVDHVKSGMARGMFVLPATLVGQVSGSPAAPPKGAALMQDALNWVLWGGLFLCAVAVAGGAGTIGVSRISGQVNHSNTGKQVLMGGLFGSAGIGLAIPLVNMLFAAAGR